MIWDFLLGWFGVDSGLSGVKLIHPQQYCPTEKRNDLTLDG